MKFTTFLLLMTSVTWASASTLTLNSALHEVLKDSPTIGISESEKEESYWSNKEALSGFLPHLSLNATYLTDKKYQYLDIDFGGNPTSIPQVIPTSQFNLLAELPLFNGLASLNHLEATQKFYEASEKKLDWQTLETQMKVVKAFYTALASQQLKEVATQNVKVLEDHLNRARLFIKNGLSTHYDLLKVEVEVSQAKTDLADREDDIIITKDNLAEMLGHGSEERELVGELPIPSREKLESIESEKSHQSNIEALELTLAGKDLERRSQNRFWVPSFSLFAQYTMYNNISDGFDDWDVYRNARQVGLAMTWNLFDGLASYSQAKKSIEEKVQATKKLQETKLATQNKVRVWRRKYLSQCRIYEARKEDVKKSLESVRLAKEGKEVGSQTDTDLLDAESMLYRARASVVEAQLEAVKAMIELRLANGLAYNI